MLFEFFAILYSLATILPALAGVVLLIIAAIPRKVGDAPHCRKCQYNLTGITSQRCPECGRNIDAKLVIRGRREKRTRLMIVGYVLCGVAWLFFLGNISTGNVYRHVGIERVIRSIQSESYFGWPRAYNELERRIKAGEVSQSDLSPFVQWTLDNSERYTHSTEFSPKGLRLANLLDLARVRNLLTDTQEVRFKENLVKFDLDVRQIVVTGDKISCQLNTYRFMANPGWWVNSRAIGAFIDCKPIDFYHGNNSPIYLLAYAQCSGTGHNVAPVALPLWTEFGQAVEPGRHTLTLDVYIRVFNGPWSNRAASTLIREETITLEQTFEVVVDAHEDCVDLSDDGDIGEKIKRELNAHGFRYTKSRHPQINGRLRMDEVPMSFAFKVYALIDNNEKYVGTITSERPFRLDPYEFRIYWYHPGPAIETVDLILRSDRKHLRESTVDIYEAWDGEIILEDIPVAPAGK